MRRLRLTTPQMQGDDVSRWQSYLRGAGYDIAVDGVFGPRTDAATRTWQAARGLVGDGIVWTKSYAVAMLDGFSPVEPLEDTAEDRESPLWPPRPADLRPLDDAGRAALFGKLVFEPDPSPEDRERVRITSGLDLVTVEVPELQGVAHGPKSGRVSCHRLAGPKLRELFAEWAREGVLERVKTWGGCFSPRFIRGSRTRLSNHAWGTAFDINVPWNGLGRQPALAGKPGSVRELVPTANRLGWYWGGHFMERPDGMHFELSRV